MPGRLNAHSEIGKHYSETLNVRLTREQSKTLDEYCDRTKQNKTIVIRRFIGSLKNV